MSVPISTHLPILLIQGRVYVRNLEERVKIPDLVETLTAIFSDYGNILEVVAKTNVRAKGQAFVVFDDPTAAARAVEEVQGFEVFKKPMELAIARQRSDALVKKHASGDDFELHKRRRVADKERRVAVEQQAEAANKLKRPAGAPDAAAVARPAKTARGAGLKSTASSAVVPDEYLPPNKILFVQNVSDDYDMESLSVVFSRFEGFREVRMVPGRRGLAFVEYEAEQGAISAKESTAGMTLGTESKPLKVTFQRQ